MSEHEPLFFPASFFMLRAPFLPFDAFKHIHELEDPKAHISEFYTSNARFREAVAIASPSLKKEIESGRNIKDIENTLFKYFSRSASRSTPFGLFAFASYGFFGSNVIADLDLNQLIKRSRPDMEWLQKVIEKICLDSNLIQELPIQRNPLLVCRGERFSISYLREKEDQAGISIRASALTRLIFLHTQKPILLRELIDKVLQELPHLEPVKIQEVIEKLLKEQFLWFSLLPSLIALNPFQEFLKNVPKVHFDALFQISQEIEKYSQCTDENAGALLEQLETRMKPLADSRCYLQVDATVSSQITLPASIAQEISQVAEVLWKLSLNENVSILDAYRNQFINKYGRNCLVPLLDLLDKIIGLGTPEIYHNFVPSVSPLAASFKINVADLLGRSLKDRKFEIELSDDLIKKWSHDTALEKAPPSMEVFFELIADSAKDIESGNYDLAITNLSWQGGGTFGRFLDLFGEDFREKMRGYFAQEEALDPRSTFVESSYLPPMSRHQNVSTHPNLRKEVIDLSPSGLGTIAIEDVYVGISDDRFFLTSKEGTVEYHVTVSNLLNHSYAPIPLRFIRDVSRAKYRLCDLWSWRDFEFWPFLPRVRFKKAILSAAEWNVNLERIGGTTADSVENLIDKFRKWADDFQMVRYIFLANGDQKLLIDRFNRSSLEEVVRMLKNGHFLKFIEKVGQNKGNWINSQLGKHCAEFVLPLLKNPKFSRKKIPFEKRLSRALPMDSRLRLPGSDWLFVKLYLPQQNEKRFLTQHLWQFADFFREQQLIDEWFFIRYGDDRSHVRVRFHATPEKLHQHVLNPLFSWTHSLLKDEIIQDIAITSYEREIERYGGLELIESAESVFCADSQTALSLMSIDKKLNLPAHVLGALSILDLMKSLNFDRKAQQAFFKQFEIDKSELEGFREWKKVLVLPADPLMQEAFERRSAMHATFAEKMFSLESQNKLTATPFSILDSLIHMHCNRLFGTDLKLERKARAFACHALQSQLQPSKVGASL